MSIGVVIGLYFVLGWDEQLAEGRDRIVVSTSRCGRDNPGSNPGHGRGCVVSIMASQQTFWFHGINSTTNKYMLTT